MIGGIYIILNKENNKIYIGSTYNFKMRWARHKRTLNLGKHHSKHLQYAWNKYGADVFEFIEFEYVLSENELIEREQVWLDFFKPFVLNGYNICPTAGNSKGFKHTEETKLQIKNSIAKVGYTHSAETRKRMSTIMIDKKIKVRKVNYEQVLQLKNNNPTLSNRKIGLLLNISGQSIGKIIKRYTV